MSDQPRALPNRPSLRYLKLEAKRRLAMGEFATLTEAQLAIAREHGMPSWTALKEHIEADESHALAQVRWILSRFATSGAPQWTEPAEQELREHFDEHYLGLVPPDTLLRLLGAVSQQLREGLTEVRAEPSRLRARAGDLRIEAETEPEPPHRLHNLRLYPLETKVKDPRIAAPPRRDFGAVPEDAAAVAEESFGELGLAGLIVAGATEDGSMWATARGWADLDRGEVLSPDHKVPAFAITQLITAVVVLQLVADGRVRLDAPASTYLRTVRLADDAITVRDLLCHTDGVESPAPLFADTVPDLITVTGPVAACTGSRGTFTYGYGGFAMLGQLIADVTGTPYEEVATRTVLEPLGMRDSSFPRSWPASGAITGHRLTDEGMFEPVPGQVSVAPASSGLWTTAVDLLRFGLGWASLLPDALAREALTPQAEGVGSQAGLGWVLVPAKDIAGHPGAGSGCSASLIIRPGGGRPWVVVTDRQVLVEAVNERLAIPIAEGRA